VSTRTQEHRTGPRITAWYERLTVLRAIRTIVVVALVLVVVGGVLVRLLEPETFTSLELACWWAVTTVTTVGYGDVVPVTAGGRLVGAALMLTGVSLIPLVTSVVVSILTAKRAKVQHQEQATRLARIEEQLERMQR
jgi:voltage-gated potassium channel